MQELRCRSLAGTPLGVGSILWAAPSFCPFLARRLDAVESLGVFWR